MKRKSLETRINKKMQAVAKALLKITKKKGDKSGQFAVVGPSPYQRKWFASITRVDGLISKVS